MLRRVINRCSAPASNERKLNPAEAKVAFQGPYIGKPPVVDFAITRSRIVGYSDIRLVRAGEDPGNLPATRRGLSVDPEHIHQFRHSLSAHDALQRIQHVEEMAKRTAALSLMLAAMGITAIISSSGDTEVSAKPRGLAAYEGGKLEYTQSENLGRLAIQQPASIDPTLLPLVEPIAYTSDSDQHSD